jgi:hypothetical protein
VLSNLFARFSAGILGNNSFRIFVKNNTMTYLTIKEDTKEGKELLAMLKKSRVVEIHNKPNEETKKALREAKSGVNVTKVKDVKGWLKKIWG